MSAPDSTPTPTPVTELGWRAIAMTARTMAEDATLLARRYGDPRLPGCDMARSRRCVEIARRLGSIEDRVRCWVEIDDGEELSRRRADTVEELRTLTRETERLDAALD